MKPHFTLVGIILLSMVASPVNAGLAASLETEFLLLREKRDKALATVAVPINDGYRVSLEKLLKRAITEKDKDTAAKIQFELQTIGAVGTSSTLPAQELALTPEMTALKQKLADTKWRIDKDKTFMLFADGSSTANWTPRKGRWKVIDDKTVELDVGNIQRQEKVSVSQGVTLMTWLDREEDQAHSKVAKKIVPIADK